MNRSVNMNGPIWTLVLSLAAAFLWVGCAQGGTAGESCDDVTCQSYCQQAGYGQGECVEGACLCHYTPTGLDGGWHQWTRDGADACGGCGDGEMCCDGICVGVLSNPTNCGFCGKTCAEGEQCVNGWCLCGGQSHCYENEKCCNGECVNILYDPTNCGDCGVECEQDIGPECVEGQCVCPVIGDPNPRPCAGTREDMCCPRTFLASGGCTDLDNDREHCGACEKSCDFANGEICFMGQCVLGQN